MNKIYCAAALLLLVASGIWVAIPAQGQVAPQPVYTRVIRTQQADFSWDTAKKGSVKGNLKFSAKRASAPVVIYLKRVDGEGKFTVPDMLEVSQKEARFEPGFAVMVAGQKAKFLNDEKKEISHNVYFLGAAEVDLGIFDQAQSVEHQFTAAGEVSVHCSIHKNMDAKYFIAPSPAFALVENDATSFTISGVPEGKYQLKTWQKQKRFKDAEMDVTVEADKEASVTVEMAR